ncbi:MAG: 3-deoxy-manno-octulosonate cytidylyltransferase, partial [Deltaproteobacteria bacterium]
ILGKPMIQWVYEAARKASLVDMAVVATDDLRIFSAVEAFGGHAVMTSPHHKSGTDRVAEAAHDIDADIIVNLQGDEPLMKPHMIDAAIGPMLDDPSINICTLKTEICDLKEYNDPNAVKVVTDKHGYALYFSRSPIPFARVSFEDAGIKPYKHIGLYVFRKDFLLSFTGLQQTPLEKAECLEQLRALENGFKIKVVEVDYNPVSVDTAEDLERVKGILKREAGGKA